jgi:hypothetical protein
MINSNPKTPRHQSPKLSSYSICLKTNTKIGQSAIKKTHSKKQSAFPEVKIEKPRRAADC